MATNRTQGTRLEVAGEIASEIRRTLLRQSDARRAWELAGLLEIVCDADIAFLRANEQMFTLWLSSNGRNPGTTVLSKID